MVLRNFIEINKEKCNGCGNCVVACAEGALQIIDGKAEVVNESFCDGLGACIGECPMDALKITQKDVARFDEAAVNANTKQNAQHKKDTDTSQGCSGGCPGSAMQYFERGKSGEKKDSAIDEKSPVPSQLKQWPVQLQLVNPFAWYFAGADLLIAADCSAYAYGDFHKDFIKDKVVIIACPKLDNTWGYSKKLAQIIKEGPVSSITIARMEVPCCGGLTKLVRNAVKKSGRDVPIKEKVISAQGELK